MSQPDAAETGAKGRPGLPFHIKLFFGMGQIAEGLKNRTFETFLFFYYVQVLGLSPGLAGLAMLIAVISDAVTDPLVGTLTDGHRSRMGRRHPFMYGAALPLGLLFVLMFNPPEALDEQGLFIWLTVGSVLARTALSVYHVPHMALGAELSSDYNERTTVVAYRSWFQLASAWSVTPLAFALFFTARPNNENGQLDPSSYFGFSLFFGIIMAAAILLTALGTHSRIPMLPASPPKTRRLGPGRVITEFREAWRSPSCRVFVYTLLGLSIGAGVQRVLELHMFTYFWLLSPEQIRDIGVAGLLGAIVGVPCWARFSRYLGKKWTLILGNIMWMGFLTLPPFAAMLGAFPGKESTLYIPLLVASMVLAAFGNGGTFAVGGSLAADLVDEHALATGERREGMFFGVFGFCGKASPGIGIWLAGLVLEWIDFPVDAEPGAISELTVNRLVWVYGPTVFLFVTVTTLLMLRYRITKEALEDIQDKLASRRLPR